MKFEFPLERRKVNTRVYMMDPDQRRQFEKDRYNVLKQEISDLTQSDGSVVYYVIDVNWINQWKAFIFDSRSMPGEIYNS